MSVPFDLSVYVTIWKDLDLKNQPILDLIELESKMVAIYTDAKKWIWWYTEHKNEGVSKLK